MLIQEQIQQLFTQAIAAAQAAGDLPEFPLPAISVERPKDSAHGDYAVPSAMKMAGAIKKAGLGKMPPFKIAEAILAHIPPTEYLAELYVAKPGFINIRLSTQWLAEQVERILVGGEQFGHLTRSAAETKKIQVEYISANPTGPLAVASGRNAVLGDVLASLLEASGHTVQREYYLNDKGGQVDHLGRALYVRYGQALGHDLEEYDQYTGSYLVEIGQALAGEMGDKYWGLEEAGYLPIFRNEALKRIIAGIKEDTALIGIHFDRWFSEQSLHDDGTYAFVYDKLNTDDRLVEREGAIWLKSDDESDKENVVVRSNGTPTYFASDIAYVWNKLHLRQFEQAIYVWGADHHGHIKRLKNVASSLGLEPERVTIVLHQMVSITRNGIPVKQSKRAGSFITVSEVVEEIGTDAFRFMMLTRSADSSMELDLALAQKQDNENPVYYVQYGHARVCSILRKAEDGGATMDGGAVSLLTHPAELTLIREMLRLEEVIAYSAVSLAPHQLTYYAQSLATAFHAFYHDCKVVNEDNAPLTSARLKLVKAAQITLANTLRLMGMSAPEKM